MKVLSKSKKASPKFSLQLGCSKTYNQKIQRLVLQNENITKKDLEVLKKTLTAGRSRAN